MFDGTSHVFQDITTSNSVMLLYNYTNPHAVYMIHIEAFSVLSSEPSPGICIMLPIEG